MESHRSANATYKKYMIDIKNFKVLDKINSGSFSSVFSVQNQINGDICASKVLTSYKNDEHHKKMIAREIQILIRCQHPTIIKFLGYSFKDFHDEKNVTLFMEFAKNGSLAEILEKAKKGILKDIFDNTSRQIILVGIARGMMYLHQHKIIHRDLKPGNILIDEKYYPHITDFNLSKIYETDQPSEHSQQCGTSLYMAPELIEGAPYNAKIDVYSFGILMYQVVTDSSPYPDVENGKFKQFQFFNKVVQEDYRPKFEVKIKKSIKMLIEKCWSKNPKERPTFEEIFKKLAYNIDDSFEDIYEDQNEEEDENKYYLDDVNEDEVIFYADEIDKSIDDISLKIESIIKPLKDENEELKKKLSQIENLMIKKLTIKDFNSMSLKSQQIVLSEIIVQISNLQSIEFFKKIKDIILYLLNYINTEVCSSFEIAVENEDVIFADAGNDFKIRILSNATEILFKNNVLNSDNFKSFLKSFNIVILELKYPSELFSSVYENVLMLKKSEKIEIEILTSDVTLFKDDENIDSIKIGNICSSITSIGEKAYYGCNRLTKASIPSFITSIGELAFNECTKLTQITIPSSVTSIENSAFNGCSSLTQIEIPFSITSIGESAFTGCSSLTQIAFPSSVTFIGCDAFSQCSSLAQITIPSSITSINDGTFKKCYSLTQIAIPSSVTSIGYSAFSECSSLLQITIPSSVTSIGCSAFEKCSFLSKILIPSTVTYIGSGCFSNCTSLKEVSLGSIHSIEPYTFSDCKSLMNINIPKSVKYIGNQSFLNCILLSKINLPTFSTVYIENNAFLGCLSNMLILSYNKNDCFTDRLREIISNRIGLFNSKYIYFPGKIVKTYYGLLSQKIWIPAYLNHCKYIESIDYLKINEFISQSYFSTIFKVIDQSDKEYILKSIPSSIFFIWGRLLKIIRISDLNLPGIIKIKGFRLPLSKEEIPQNNLTYYEVEDKSGEKVKLDLTGNIIITEYYKNGDLYTLTNEYLKSNGQMNEKMNPTIRSKIIFGVAATMKNLHKNNYIHCCLIINKIFLDENFEPKIGGLQYARHPDDFLKECNPAINWSELESIPKTHWVPDIFLERDDDDENENFFTIDVYNFALLMYQMFAGEVVFKHRIYTNNYKQAAYISMGKRPIKPKNIPDVYWELIQNCWKKNPEERYTFEEITNILKDDKYAIEEYGMKTDLDQLHEYQKRMDVEVIINENQFLVD